MKKEFAMSDEAAFLAALKANPADDTTRLVYADWLDEHDEPQKAEYLRAVAALARLPGGTDDYTQAAARLYTACVLTDGYWRLVAGARFDVVLERYEPSYKIQSVKIIRERTKFGLAESKALAESVPTPLFSWLPFERALPHLLAFATRPLHAIEASIRPTAWPEGLGPETVFDILLCELHASPENWRQCATGHIAKLLGITPEQVNERLRHLPLVVGSGLRPVAVAEFVRRLKLACNVGRALPPGAIRVIPRLPT